MTSLLVLLGNRNDALHVHEVGQVQHEHVQDVRFDPFAAVQQPAQRAKRLAHGYAERLFQRVAGAHLIRDRTDTADPGGDVGHFGVVPSAEKCLVEPRRLKDLQLHFGDSLSFGPNQQAPFSLDAGQVLDLDHTLRNLTSCGAAIHIRHPSA